MYTPPHFAEDSKEALHQLIREHSFGILVTGGDAGLQATHLPFLLDHDGEEPGVLLGHVARANPQWKALAERQTKPSPSFVAPTPTSRRAPT